MAAFAVKIEFMKNNVFGRGNGHFSACREYALSMLHRPVEVRVVLRRVDVGLESGEVMDDVEMATSRAAALEGDDINRRKIKIRIRE